MTDKKHGILNQFINPDQLSVLDTNSHGEEGEFFIGKMEEISNIIATMPKTYETDGQGEDAIIYLHYFTGSCDWYVTEKDMEEDQLQAFGLANLGCGAELGYISIQELIANNVELDLYWEPKAIKDI